MLTETREITSTTSIIHTATQDDAHSLVTTLVLAFSSDPVARYMYPQPYQFLTHFPSFVRAFGGKAFEHGTAYFTDQQIGAALWFPPGVEPDEEPLINLIQHSIAEAKHPELFAVLEQMGHYHPDEPHWYLPMLGVEPTQQGKGHGSALLLQQLRQCDRENQLAYLESSSPKNIPLYERHGFKLLGIIREGTFPPIFPMLRYPKSITQ